MPFASLGVGVEKFKDARSEAAMTASRNMNATEIPKAVRQLRRAEGYIELHLPDRALAELDAIQDQGPFEAAVALLRGEALKSQEKYIEAVDPLKRAAVMIPAPLNKRAWRSLSECYRLSGRDELADIADLVVNSETAPAESQGPVHIAVVPLPMLTEAIKAFLAKAGPAEDQSTE
jgi:tetratricopeptide (TPR) repeat protein